MGGVPAGGLSICSFLFTDSYSAHGMCGRGPGSSELHSLKRVYLRRDTQRRHPRLAAVPERSSAGGTRLVEQHLHACPPVEHRR
jgi:hypothetical protein